MHPVLVGLVGEIWLFHLTMLDAGHAVQSMSLNLQGGRIYGEANFHRQSHTYP